MARRWTAVLARLGERTGDGRILAPGGITSRDLPLPLMWQERTEGGHGGSRVVGRIETISFTDEMVTATGSMLDSSEWSDAVEQIEAGVVGPSVDLDDVEYAMDDQDNIVITRGRIAGATLVPVPAFEGVSISLVPRPVEDVPVAEYVDVYGARAGMTGEAQTLEQFTASASAPAPARVLPPADWFGAPDVDRLTPLTVTDTGRVFGHIAGWDTCHVGLPGCVTPPRSASAYASFLVGEQATAEGSFVAVGTLVTGPRHASPELTFRAAAQHYDDLNSAVAKVAAGEDEFGIWVAGWLLPGADPAKVETFMSSAVSGDWRRVGGNLELIAVCSVNAPGFPVPRARVAFASGAQNSLIASTGALPVRGEVKEREAAEPLSEMDALARWAWAQTKG